MKEEQKERISKLREQGLGYKRIAGIIGETVSAVRNVCVYKENVCQNCGRKLNHTPGKMKRKYCSNKCRYGYWNKHKKKCITVICKHCGKEFLINKGSKRNYCSRECYVQERLVNGWNK